MIIPCTNRRLQGENLMWKWHQLNCVTVQQGANIDDLEWMAQPRSRALGRSENLKGQIKFIYIYSEKANRKFSTFLKVPFCQKVRCGSKMCQITTYPEQKIWIRCLLILARNSNFLLMLVIWHIFLIRIKLSDKKLPLMASKKSGRLFQILFPSHFKDFFASILDKTCGGGHCALNGVLCGHFQGIKML